MPEDAFERFRRLRAVSPAGADSVPALPTEDPASMSPLALFQALQAYGVQLTPYPDSTLRYTAPAGTLPPGLLDQIPVQTAALHTLVEAFEERAGIAEYCGGLSREDAERLAWETLLQKEMA